MIFDGRSQSEPPSDTNYDILVIGGGPAGVTIANELHETGLRIALLESGGEDFDGDTQMLYDGPVTGLERIDLTAMRLRMFGGTSNHWGGRCLPMDEIDFTRTQVDGASGWPFSRAHMDPYYTRAHVYCDLGAYEYDTDAIAEVSHADFILPHNPDLLTKVLRLSTPTNFSSKYKSVFEISSTMDLWLWTNVTGLEVDALGRQSAVLTMAQTGVQRRFTAKDFVFACGGVENPRLLLEHNATHGQRIGDEAGLLGACYMDHLSGGAGFLWTAEPTPAKANWDPLTSRDDIPIQLVWRLSDEILEAERLNNIQFYLIPFSTKKPDPRVAEANRGWSNLKNIAKYAIGRDISGGPFVLSDAYCEIIMNADAMAEVMIGAVDTSDTTDRILLRCEAEQRPDTSNRVTLTDERDALGNLRAAVHWSPSLDDKDSIVRSAIKIGEICGAAGIGRVELEDHFNTRYWDASTTWHQLGTTRMATSPQHGVVDADMKIHGTQNMFFAGGSVFPTGGRANPTLTIVALSVRLADHLKSRNPV